MSTGPSRSTEAYAKHGAAFGSIPLELYDRPSAPLELEIQEPRYSRQLRRVEPARVPRRHAASSLLEPPNSLHRLAKNIRTGHPISYLDTLMKK